MADSSPTADLRVALARLGAELSDHGWLMATGGNLSARLPGAETAVVTASGGDKGHLTAADFVEVRVADGVKVAGDGRPSAETGVHMAIYRATDAVAVAHAHAPYVTLVSRRLADRGAVRFEGWEFVKALGFWDEGAAVEVPIVANHHSLDALADAVAAAVGPAPAVLVAGHGVYAWGDSIDAVGRHVQAIEFMCRMVWEWELARPG